MKKPNRKSNFHPSGDGVDHINIYTRGRTRLGVLATNLSDVPVIHPKFGHFRTAEGLYYWLKTGKIDDGYRILSGFEAKRKGQEQPIVWNKNFQEEFASAIIYKTVRSEEIQALLKSFLPDLPFAHYYWYGNQKDPHVVEPKGHEWQVELWTEMRRRLISGENIIDLILSEDLRG